MTKTGPPKTSDRLREMREAAAREGVIEMVCTCGQVGRITVADPESLSDDQRREKFSERGWKRGRCHWCAKKRVRHEHGAI